MTSPSSPGVPSRKWPFTITIHSLWLVRVVLLASDDCLRLHAAHVSSDGKTIAALTEDSSLLLIKDVLSVIGNRTKLQDASLTLTFNQPPNTKRPPEAIYLAFEFGRVGVITASLYTYP